MIFYVRFLLHLVSLQGGCLLILHQKKFPLRLTGDHMDVLVSKVVLTHQRRRRCETSLRKWIHAISNIFVALVRRRSIVKWWWFSCFLMFTAFRKREIRELRHGRATTAKKCIRSVQKSVMRMRSSIVFFVVVVVVVVAAELPWERFLSRDQQLCKLIGTKEGFYIRKRFNPHRTGLEHGRRYVRWKCRIRKEWGQQWDNFLWINTFKTQNFDCGKWRAKWPNFILNGQPSFGNPFLKVVCYASLQWK